MRPATLTIAATLLTLGALPAAQAPAFAQETPSDATPATTGTLTISFSGFEAPEGRILIGVYDEAGWTGGEPVRGGVVNLAAGETTIVIEGLRAGRYGIKAIHDANANGKMDQNPFGMPTESFAFSNNAPVSMGPPKWEDAAFELTAEGAQQSITIR